MVTPIQVANFTAVIANGGTLYSPRVVQGIGRNPDEIEEFEPEKKWWNKRVENNYAWKVSIEEIEKRNYNS